MFNSRTAEQHLEDSKLFRASVWLNEQPTPDFTLVTSVHRSYPKIAMDAIPVLADEKPDLCRSVSDYGVAKPDSCFSAGGAVKYATEPEA